MKTDKPASLSNDARLRRSRDSLQTALLELISEKPFEQLFIREIAKRAGISLPTFYRQFASKEDLLNDIAAEEIQALLEICLPLMDVTPQAVSSEVICQYVAARQVLWRTLLTTGASAILRAEFISRSKTIGRSRKLRNPELPIDLMTPLIAGGIFEILSWWLQQDHELPLRAVAELLDKLVLWPTQKRIAIEHYPIVSLPRN